MHDIVALSLPCYGTTARTMGNAQRLCTRLGCDFREIDIKEACDLHLRDIGHCGEPEGAAYENTQARERTQLLFDLSNHEGALAVGTGDLSEMALGWCTYGGDQMAMYNVNAGVPKTLVRYLIEWISGQEDMAEVKEILKDILETPVSPELLPPDRTGSIAQKTEEIIGPYELHDFFLYHTIRYGAPPRKVIFLARTAFGDRYASGEIARWARLFYRRFFASQFKRSCTPDGPKIGSISLSPRTDWRMPSDACPDLWLDPGEFEDSGNGC
ncbi:MAG TPA: hypothetical protein DD727_08880 [Clostridiales bacterium]|nr:hypothetical protein [Clostridiales bacterium]